MPVYGRRILGGKQFEEAARIEKATAGVYGKRMRMGVKVEAAPADEPPAPTAITPAIPNQNEVTSETVAIAREAETFAMAFAKLEGILGESYSVSDAEAALATAPEYWEQFALAELHRGQTIGVRKGIIKLLAETEVTGTDRTLLDDLIETLTK